MQSQLVCNGCRSILLYPRGATNVCCAVCNTVTPVTPPAMEMAQLVCVGCRTLLMYSRGATSVRCSCCNTINIARSDLSGRETLVRITANQVAHVNCGQCHTTLMYPYGSPSVKCSICHYVTNVGMNNIRAPTSSSHRPNDNTSLPPSTSVPPTQAQSMTVVVENPMSVDERGKLVSNLVVGVTTGKK